MKDIYRYKPEIASLVLSQLQQAFYLQLDQKQRSSV